MCKNMFQHSFEFNFHPEICFHDKELLLGFVCVHRDIYVCLYIYIGGFVSEREKSVAGYLNSAWN